MAWQSAELGGDLVCLKLARISKKSGEHVMTEDSQVDGLERIVGGREIV